MKNKDEEKGNTPPFPSRWGYGISGEGEEYFSFPFSPKYINNLCYSVWAKARIILLHVSPAFLPAAGGKAGVMVYTLKPPLLIRRGGKGVR